MVLGNSIDKTACVRVRWVTMEAGMTIHNQRKVTFHSSPICNTGVREVSVHRYIGVVWLLLW